MKTFDLELRVETFGSVITWEILLEDATNHNQRLRDWMQADLTGTKSCPVMPLQMMFYRFLQVARASAAER